MAVKSGTLTMRKATLFLYALQVLIHEFKKGNMGYEKYLQIKCKFVPSLQ